MTKTKVADSLTEGKGNVEGRNGSGMSAIKKLQFIQKIKTRKINLEALSKLFIKLITQH